MIGGWGTDIDAGRSEYDFDGEIRDLYIWSAFHDNDRSLTRLEDIRSVIQSNNVANTGDDLTNYYEKHAEHYDNLLHGKLIPEE